VLDSGQARNDQRYPAACGGVVHEDQTLASVRPGSMTQMMQLRFTDLEGLIPMDLHLQSASMPRA
jgi:hypothetical protein